MRTLQLFALMIGSVSFGLGISLPLLHMETFWIFSEKPSLIQIIYDLWIEEERLLSLIVALFSILFPLVKLWSAHQKLFAGKAPLSLSTYLAKWSMLDVLLVAIVIFTAKTSGIANASTQIGVWFFFISTIAVAFANYEFPGNETKYEG